VIEASDVAFVECGTLPRSTKASRDSSKGDNVRIDLFSIRKREKVACIILINVFAVFLTLNS